MALGFSQTLSTGQEQRQAQEMHLSLQARQRLELLQLPLIELTTSLRQKAEQNPFLEFEPPLHGESLEAAQEAYLREEQKDSEYFNSGREGYGDQKDPAAREEAARKHDWQIASLTEPETLYRHLERQVLEQMTPGPERELVLFVCAALDARGYLRESQQALLSAWFSACGGTPVLSRPQDLERAIRTVQTLDPVGVGARSLRECLELQIRADDRYNLLRDLEIRLCQRLESVATQRPEQLAKILRCTPEELRQALADLRKLNPAPGLAYARQEPLGVPEIVAIQRPDGSWKAVCDERNFPLFRVDEASVEEAKAYAKGRDEQKQVADWERQADSWVEAYHERNETLQRVAQLTFDRQGAYLASGGNPATLKPLLQRDIAQAIGYDESIVSRAIKDKSVRVATSRKLLSLSSFFSRALPSSASTEAESLSDKQVKSVIKALIDAEDPARPLSDEALTKALADQHHLTLARRTVAKYREQLGIPSTRDRKRKLL